MAARFIAARCDHGPAVIRTLALAALALAGPMVTALPAAAARPDVRAVSVTHVVAKNDEATLVARVAPANAHCNLVIYLRSGPSAARGLGAKRAGKGRVPWDVGQPQHDAWDVTGYVECGPTGIA